MNTLGDKYGTGYSFDARKWHTESEEEVSSKHIEVYGLDWGFSCNRSRTTPGSLYPWGTGQREDGQRLQDPLPAPLRGQGSGEGATGEAGPCASPAAAGGERASLDSHLLPGGLPEPAFTSFPTARGGGGSSPHGAGYTTRLGRVVYVRTIPAGRCPLPADV